ncbi:DUF4406 domain-containing protein [Bengtsoniella intestinalis]|uniref:DUF7768 domain-containing protein n=1 Tax=Bengtsoniella intestinalis TaxID=3073143 RepID=UPI00391FAB1E
MTNFFQEELRKMFGDGKIIPKPHFTGRSCLGRLDDKLRVKVEFRTSEISTQYDTLHVEILSPSEGKVDLIRLSLKELLGQKKTSAYPNGITPHIWDKDGKPSWYSYKPTSDDYRTMGEAVGTFVSVWRPKEQELNAPKLVYICAPLRGDVEKNIAFATEKAKEVFLDGDIPVCPHLMFPPIADPENEIEDEQARHLGLKLVESCQAIHVYGTEWTDGMWAEIHHAEKRGIPIYTDQTEVPRSRPVHPRQPSR